METRKGSAWKTITSAEAYVGGAWRTLRYAEAYISGTWRKVASFVQVLTLSDSGDTGVNAAATDPPSPMTTPAVTVTPSGGLGPFSYHWVLLSSSNLTGITINSPSLASTTFTATISGSTPHSATFRCTCTDSLGSTATADVNAIFSNATVGGTA